MSFLPHGPIFPTTIGADMKALQQTPHQSSVGQKGARTNLTAPGNPASAYHFAADARGFSGRIPDLASALYGLPYTNLTSLGYNPFHQNTDQANFQATLNRMNHPGVTDQWRPHVGQSPYYPYDPAMASLLCQGGYTPLGLGESGRRKNATRETTATLKAWLNEHRKNPYPTKGEKIMLAIVSKMTLTQVSTWFANARRRLKKENRMTWSPRNRCGDDRMSEDEEVDDVTTENNSASFDREQVEHQDIRGANSPRNDDPPTAFSPTNKRQTSDSEQSSESQRSEGIPYNHIHAQLFLRQLASIPPHLRPADVYRQYRQSLQDNAFDLQVPKAADVSQASKALSDKSYRSAATPSSKHAYTRDNSQAEAHRRHSLNSTASTSSCDRSPSPLCDPTNFTHSLSASRANPCENMGKARDHKLDRVAATERKAVDLVQGDRDDEALSQRNQEQDKKLCKIWSPIGLPERARQQQTKAASSLSEMPQVFRENPLVSDTINRNSLTGGESDPMVGAADWQRLASDLSQRSCSSNDDVSEKRAVSEKAVNDWLSEYNRQLAYQRLTAKTQHALAATLATLAVKRRSVSSEEPGQFVTQDHEDKFCFGADRTDDMERNDNDDAAFDTDINMPMNLSKNKDASGTSGKTERFSLDNNRAKRIMSSVAAT